MSTTSARSLGLLLAITVTAGILGSIAQIAAAERQAAFAAAKRSPAAQLAVACEPALDPRL